MNDFFKSIVNDSNVQTTRRTFDFGDFLMNIANKTLDSCGCKVRVYKTEKMYEGYSLYSIKGTCLEKKQKAFLCSLPVKLVYVRRK